MQLCFSQLKKRPRTPHNLTFPTNSGSLSCYYYSEATHSKMQAFEQWLWWMKTYLVHSNHSFFTNIYNHIHRNRLRITHNQLAIGTKSVREKVLGANWPSCMYESDRNCQSSSGQYTAWHSLSWKSPFFLLCDYSCFQSWREGATQTRKSYQGSLRKTRSNLESVQANSLRKMFRILSHIINMG